MVEQRTENPLPYLSTETKVPGGGGVGDGYQGKEISEY